MERYNRMEPQDDKVAMQSNLEVMGERPLPRKSCLGMTCDVSLLRRSLDHFSAVCLFYRILLSGGGQSACRWSPCDGQKVFHTVVAAHGPVPRSCHPIVRVSNHLHTTNSNLDKVWAHSPVAPFHSNVVTKGRNTLPIGDTAADCRWIR